MKFRAWQGSVVLSLIAVIVSGCGQADNKGGAAKVTSGQVAVAKPGGQTKHDGWWCDEHGVPEAECSMCSAKVAAEFKEKGDWCDQHDRAKSQCFLCDPGLEARYAARYEARYGKKPPVPEENRTRKEQNK